MDNEQLAFNILVSDFLGRDLDVVEARARALGLIRDNSDYLDTVREWENSKERLQFSIKYSFGYQKFIKFLNKKIGFESTGISLSDNTVVIGSPEVSEHDFTKDLIMDKTYYVDYIVEFINVKDFEIYGQR